MNDQNVGKQIAKGTFWTVLMRMSLRVLGIISILILARLLVPEDYGLVAKAVLVGGFLELITQFGFGPALIRNQKATKDDYDTVWTLSILRAVCIGVVLISFAPFISSYFNEPRIENLIYCYALASIVMGFDNVGIIDFQKNMDFDLDFKFSLYKKLSSFLTTITIALIWQSYWAFPIGVLVGNFFGLVASFKMSKYRPSLSLKSIRTLFHFSKWMFLYEILGAFSTKLDSFLLSKFSTSEELGVYTIAYEVSGMPSTEVAMPVARVALPGLSKLNHDGKKFRSMYASILSSIFFLVIPAAAGLSILSAEITAVLLGENWYQAGPIISILAFFGLTRVITACSVSALIAFNRVDMVSKISILAMLIRVIILPIGILYYGLLGLAYSMLIAGIVTTLITLIIQQRLRVLSIGTLFHQIWRVVISTLIMTAGLYAFIGYFESIQSWVPILGLILKVGVGFLSFCLPLCLFCIFSNWKSGPEDKIYIFIKSRFAR